MKNYFKTMGDLEGPENMDGIGFLILLAVIMFIICVGIGVIILIKV